MLGSDAKAKSGDSGQWNFATTRWSLVLLAGERRSPQSAAALAALCETYWFPLYAYIRRRGHSVYDAQDLTQAFFARLLEKNDLAAAEPGRGRFRSYLLTSLKNFLANEWDRHRAQKRGGGRCALSIDFETAEDRYRREPGHNETPETIFERRWALLLLENVLARLREEAIQSDKMKDFERLKVFLTGEPPTATYAQLSAELGTTEGNLKVAVHRLRRRYRELLREEIAQTVGDAEEVDQEIRDLFAAFQS
jgi:RNA polymerase sigma factor (sigma-70 family)